MKLPQGFIISVVVFFRYMPTVTREFWYINASMRLRDVGINIKNMLFHPIRTVEYAFVPLIIRSMTIADRLSESALTRGLDLNNKRSNYRNVKISVADISICTVLSTLVLGANSLV